ncbi:MAG: HAMP domain-containing histidine kinase [Vibrionaceae bacterium]|nr:HAMP domain-containing histidine kinase [Vibrionaceae bacterium]
MSFVDDYALTRSSVFKTLVGLFLIITITNIIVIHQVYRGSNNFHHKQLTRQLNEEILEFNFAAKQSKEDVEQLLKTKQATATPFYYRLIESNESDNLQPYYPIDLQANRHNILVGNNLKLEIGVDKSAVEEYRKSLTPMVFSGIIFPTTVMIISALFFTLLILKRLEKVNNAMNRVLCGEPNVKIAVSRQDDEFDILAIHLNFMIEQMAKNESSLKSLTTGLAHDMRTPMARLKLRLEDILAQSDLSPSQVSSFSACHDELELILSLFNSMLEIAKLNSGQVNIGNDSVDLGKVAQDALEFISPVADEKNQTLAFRQDTPCIVTGDRSLLFRAVFNLLENAVKYTPNGGHIEVITDCFGVVIADSGIGISDYDKMYVCRPMYRADQSRTESGNGLGLSLVDAVINLHNAHLFLRDNNPGLRARLYFES